jgi:hypothetical protein
MPGVHGAAHGSPGSRADVIRARKIGFEKAASPWAHAVVGREEQAMKINCLACGHKVDLDEVYDDYEGQIKCFACCAILEIKAEEGRLKTVRFLKIVPRPSLEDTFGRTT